MTWYVTTTGGYRIGPFDDFESAYFAATINFVMEGWTISHT